MLLFLTELHKEHLQLLQAHSIQVLVNFCKLAIDYIGNGANPKKYSIVAEKLNLSDCSVQNIVQAIVYLLSEGCKHNLTEADFKSTLSVAGFSAESQDVLHKLYKTKKNEISQTLHDLKQRDPTFQDLTWRFEVQVASRKQSEEIKPMITMDLVLQTPKPSHQDTNVEIMDLKQSNLDFKNKLSQLSINNGIENAKTASQCKNIINHVLIQSDISNIINMTHKLDQALKESKSQHVRKVQRALQK